MKGKDIKTKLIALFWMKKAIKSKRFIEIALGSTYETVAQLFVALDNKYISKKEFDRIYKASEEISKMLSGLSRSFK